MKKIRVFILSILMCLLFVSCSKAPSIDDGGNQDGNNNTQQPSGGLGDNNIVIPEGHKVIYTVSYELNIEDEIASTIKTVNNEVYSLKGYVSTSKESLYEATYVYKIPVEKLNDFLDKVDAQEGVYSKSIESEDVTTSYNELQAEIETLIATKTAYENMLKNDKLTLNEIMSLNDKIAQIESRLKTISKNLDSLNSRVDYATVTIKYKLKYSAPKEVFLGDYGEYLLSIGKGLIEFVAYSLPYAIIGGVAIVIVYVVRKKNKEIKK